MNKLLLCIAAAVLLTSAALGADSTATVTVTAAPPTVVIPWGDWINAAITQIVLPLLATAVTALVLWAARYLPASLRAYVTEKNTKAVEQLLLPSIATGFKNLADAEAGKTLDLSVGSQQVATAVQYALDHGAPYVVKYAGGPEGIRQKIVARLAMPASPVAPASVVTTTTTTQ